MEDNEDNLGNINFEVKKTGELFPIPVRGAGRDHHHPEQHHHPHLEGHEGGHHWNFQSDSHTGGGGEGWERVRGPSG